jgi:hypothetical protein
VTHRASRRQAEANTLLIRSEEKGRNLLEMAIYPVLILGAIIAIWQFAQQLINFPPAGLNGGGRIVCVNELDAQRSHHHPEVKV